MSKFVNDSVHWYMSELTARIVAESGIPTDRFHLGKIMMQCMKDDPDLVLQKCAKERLTKANGSMWMERNTTGSGVPCPGRSDPSNYHLCSFTSHLLHHKTDGATDKSETNASILTRAVRCAISLRNLGLQHGDVMVLMAPNHIDLSIPFYAALFCGFSIAAVDRTLAQSELQSTFSVDRPRVIFCQSDKAPDIQIALNELDLNAQIVTFDRGDYLLNFSDFMDQYGDDTTVEDFKVDTQKCQLQDTLTKIINRCEDFDPADTIAFLIATSGTTGLPKSAAVTHKNIAITTPYLWARYRTFPGPTRLALLGAPLQWLTAIMTYVISTILRYPRLVSSEALTQEHAYYLINKYKPSFTILSPTMMTTLLKPGDRDQCDFTCFDLIMLGGSAVPDDLVGEIKNVTPDTEVVNAYGMSELTNIAFHGDRAPPGSCGKPMGCFEYRLVDFETNEDIDEPNVPGELWLKGPGIFKEYYNNPAATEETFAEGRWFKTGDMFYRDENYNYFFVERIKLLLKYKSFQISPVELEAVIRQHPGVLDVAVTGIPEAECGELPVACVVPSALQPPTAQEIKDLVKETLSDSKQLRGGVIFVPAIPVTASTKVHRRKLREMALTLPRE